MRVYGPGNPLVLNHIPKTAGTSLAVGLHGALRPTVAFQGTDLSLSGVGGDRTDVSAKAAGMLVLSPEDVPADATLVAGHLAPSTTMARFPEADHITVLRNPQVRSLSHWMHSRSVSELALRHWGPFAAVFRAARRPLRDYLDDPAAMPVADNAITRFLVWPHPSVSQTEPIDEAVEDEVVEAAEARLAQFARVEVVENTAFLHELGEWLGAPLPREERNVRSTFPKARRPDLERELDASARTLLAHRCRLDERLWRRVAAPVLPGTDLTAVLRDGLDDAVGRYAEVLRRPDSRRLRRRAVEGAFELRRFAPSGRRTR